MDKIGNNLQQYIFHKCKEYSAHAQGGQNDERLIMGLYCSAAVSEMCCLLPKLCVYQESHLLQPSQQLLFWVAEHA